MQDYVLKILMTSLVLWVVLALIKITEPTELAKWDSMLNDIWRVLSGIIVLGLCLLIWI